ncbi:MAG: alpha-amylase family glycosyl hydrolase [Anaerolineales bacterium]
MTNDNLWYKDAVFYQISVRAFKDSDGDGYGDLRGIKHKLDYLQTLGVDCLWLMPIYPSPLRDDGYDIADYYNIDPMYGTLDDFASLINAAHARGIRIIMDLVLNHTSDEHPWFRLRAPTKTLPSVSIMCGATPIKSTRGLCIIFVDTEKSNWTWPKRQNNITGIALSWPTRPEFRQPKSSRRDDQRRALLGSISAWMASALTRFHISSSAKAQIARTCWRPTST